MVFPSYDMFVLLANQCKVYQAAEHVTEWTSIFEGLLQKLGF